MFVFFFRRSQCESVGQCYWGCFWRSHWLPHPRQVLRGAIPQIFPTSPPPVAHRRLGPPVPAPLPLGNLPRAGRVGPAHGEADRPQERMWRYGGSDGVDEKRTRELSAFERVRRGGGRYFKPADERGWREAVCGCRGQPAWQRSPLCVRQVQGTLQETAHRLPQQVQRGGQYEEQEVPALGGSWGRQQRHLHFVGTDRPFVMAVYFPAGGSLLYYYYLLLLFIITYYYYLPWTAGGACPFF